MEAEVGVTRNAGRGSREKAEKNGKGNWREKQMGGQEGEVHIE